MTNDLLQWTDAEPAEIPEPASAPPWKLFVVDDDKRTLPVGLAFFQGRYSADIPLMAAGALIVAAPILLVYIVFQRYFIRGMLGGAVKG